MPSKLESKPPELEKQPRPCEPCDMMVALGLLTAACEDINDPSQKTRCRELLKPLEDNKTKAVDALADIIVEMGPEAINDVVDRMNLLIYAATDKAKERLIKMGKLNPDGTPKEPEPEPGPGS